MPHNHIVVLARKTPDIIISYSKQTLYYDSLGNTKYGNRTENEELEK